MIATATHAQAERKAVAAADFWGIVEDGAGLRALRSRAGVSVAELARFVPCARPTIEALERGRIPRLDAAQWRRLAKFARGAKYGSGEE